MRIVVHDYAGHPFQVQLSRELASRGHEVLHVFSASILTPQGALARRDGDPGTFNVCPIVLDQKVDKSNLWKRREADKVHGDRAVQEIAKFKPDAIVASNTPLDAQSRLINYAKSHDARFVFWVQDLIGQAALRLLKGRIPVIGGMVGKAWVRFEEKLLNKSDAIVVISKDFLDFVPQQSRARCTVVENWAPLEEMPQFPRTNEWSQRHGLDEGQVFLYSGTLGMKHNPQLLIDIASRLGPKGARMVVASEGETVEWLKSKKDEQGLENLLLLPFQPFGDLPKMLASADVLVAVLEPDAGVFSVPSKVLSYLCAGRAVLLAVPPENLAAKIVSDNGCGRVVPPDDNTSFLLEAESLLQDPELRSRMGQAARSYAEKTFDIKRIGDDFETVLRG